MSGRDLGESMELHLKRDVLDRPGAAQIFKKPIDAEELLAALKKYCAFEPCPAE